MKGEISGLVIQALREIGKDKATQEQLERIGKLLKDEKPETISHDALLAPAWIAKIMQESMIYGVSMNFNKLIDRLKELRERFRRTKLD